MNQFKCTVCNQQRHNLNMRKSKLLKSMTLYLCNDCEQKGYEPKFLIVLVGRTQGAESVAKYIRNRLYVGSDILATELVK